MSAKNTLNSFGFIAKSFHWTISFLIIAMLVFGYFLEDFQGATQAFAYNTHRTIGIIILALVILRLGWRWYNVQPTYSSNYPALLSFLARVSHIVIYLAIIAMPLSGWVMSTAAGHPPHFMGWFYFPLPGIALNKYLAAQTFQIHNTLAIILIVLISLHILAALFHHLVLKDNVLKRMLPGQNNKE